jgi:hypothetical protein
MRGSTSFEEATGKSVSQWTQLIHYPIPVVSERREVTTGDQFNSQAPVINRNINWCSNIHFKPSSQK